MFTGTIEKTSRVKLASETDRGLRVRVEKPRVWKLRIGQSISIDGVCSTVVSQTASMFDVEYMAETLSKTTAGELAKGSIVNLERSLKYGDRIEGHFVQGHVDTHTRVNRIEEQGSSRILSISIPRALKSFVARQGSITLNGVSLTVARLVGGECSVALIPHTLKTTNLGVLKVGDAVNVEVDYLARYGIAAMREGDTVLRNAAKAVRKKTTRAKRRTA